MTVCAFIVARDEAQVIGRCLDAGAKHVDEFVVVDTGSRDATRKIARDFGATVLRRRWRDFGTNYTEAYELARPRADYALHLHADHVLLGLDTSDLTDSAYNLAIIDGGPGYISPHLISSRISWRWVGATHEYLTSDEVPVPGEAETRGALLHLCDGSRRPRKFEEDAKLLERQHRTDPGDPRTVFYLANTYRDLGRIDEAEDLYWRRVKMGGWAAEARAAFAQLERFAAGDTSSVGVPDPREGVTAT